MKRTLMTMLVALAAMLMMNSSAAHAPACPPDDFDEALELLGAKTTEQKLDMIITMLNNVYEKNGDYVKVLKNDYNNTVAMLINGDYLGVDGSLLSPATSDLFKRVFVSSLYEGEEDGEISALLNIIINAGRGLDVQVYNDNDIDNAVRITFTPSELRRIVEDHANGSLDLADDDFDFTFDEAGDPETELKKLVDVMEEYLQSNPGMDAHVWIDPHANRVVMAMTSDDFADVVEYRDMAFMFRPVFLNTLVEEASNHAFLEMIVKTGRGLQVKLCPPKDRDNPMVLDYTADELREALAD